MRAASGDGGFGGVFVEAESGRPVGPGVVHLSEGVAGVAEDVAVVYEDNLSDGIPVSVVDMPGCR